MTSHFTFLRFKSWFISCYTEISSVKKGFGSGVVKTCRVSLSSWNPLQNVIWCTHLSCFDTKCATTCLLTGVNHHFFKFLNLLANQQPTPKLHPVDYSM